MASETWLNRGPDPSSYLQKFRLYETFSNFYMIGRDKVGTFWRILKIDRLEPTELDILEDPATYSEVECCDILRRIHEGNRMTGGLKFVTTCYGIIGFVRFLGPYYMLVITKRKKLGAICGHMIYGIAKSEIIAIPNSSVQPNVAYSKDEKRYKKLLCTVDLTKDFFFSYSYHVMHSLQKNLCPNEKEKLHYETMFVWNEFLTREIRTNLKNTMWTVALVYGFFKQVKLPISGKDFKLSLIARRSRHYAGTRYLKRGVNEKGRVANDVETEQIVFEDVPEGCHIQISSVLQNRGSIPLFWSQETSRLNIKPDIRLSKKDSDYEATRLHFENLVKRYGNPIIILNLIKTVEKKPRETILREEFANAISFINKNLSKENRLRFLHWDLNRHSRRKSSNVLAILGKVATYTLDLTGIFFCEVTPDLRPECLQNQSCFEKSEGDFLIHDFSKKDEDTKNIAAEATNNKSDNHHVKAPMFQTGVLRTNCIDCLDRTNVAQYAFGLVALGRQLHALGFTDSPDISLDNPLAEELMKVYERMGDTLALQYGGSAAHNKIFCQRRGQWKAATQSQELFRTLQRYYSNAYMDAEKQDAINMFLGHFQPHQGKPALWELDSDQHYNVGGRGAITESSRSTIKRSMSEGSIPCESDSATAVTTVVVHDQSLSEQDQGTNKGLVESRPVISTFGNDICYSRYTSKLLSRQPIGDVEPSHICERDCFCYEEAGEGCNCTNFDIDWISSSGNSCEEDTFDRSVASQSSEKLELTTSASESGSSMRGGERNGSDYSRESFLSAFPVDFVRWVSDEEGLFG